MTKEQLKAIIEQKAGERAQAVCAAAERAVSTNKALTKLLSQTAYSEGTPAWLYYELKEEFVDDEIKSRADEMALFDQLSKMLKEIRDERSQRNN